MPFVKLDCGIIDSSLWVESSDTRVVFMTMLAMCDQTGLVEATAPGIARRANIEVEKVRRCLAVLEAPDQDDKSGVDEGRRIKRIAGGYVITNYLNYRNKDYTANERKRRQREREKLEMSRRDNAKCHTESRRDNATCHGTVTQAEAEAEVQSKGIGNMRGGVGESVGPGPTTQSSNHKFKPPTREELNLQASKIGLPSTEVDKFVNFYASKGWKVGKVTMKSWPHALSGWAARWREDRAQRGIQPQTKTLSQQQIEADNRRIDRLVKGTL